MATLSRFPGVGRVIHTFADRAGGGHVSARKCLADNPGALGGLTLP